MRDTVFTTTSSSGVCTMKKALSNKFVIAMFVFPALIVFLTFTVYPLIPTIYNSFHEYNGVKTGLFVGWNNYIKSLKDPVFFLAIKNTGKVLLTQLLIFGPLSLVASLVINRQSPWLRNLFKICSFIPSVLNVTVICLMWKMIFQSEWGLVDSLLNAVGLEHWIHVWFSDPKTAMWVITIVYLWQYFGFNMILFYSGIKAIPQSCLEAAYLDGATSAQRDWYIILPLMKETIKFVLILCTTGCMAMFAQVQVLTNGGPGDLTRTVVFNLYYRAFMLDDFGGASAIAVMYALFGLIVFLVINKFVAKERIEYV